MNKNVCPTIGCIRDLGIKHLLRRQPANTLCHGPADPWRWAKKIMPKYYYNHANHVEISDVYEKPMKCRICGNIKPGYGDLADRICVDCNDFVYKDTEFGIFSKDLKFEKVYNHHKSNPPKLTEDVLVKFAKTPDYTTWQQSKWLFHCNEPMN